MKPRKRRRWVGRIVTTVVIVGVLALIALGFVPKPIPASVGKVEQRTLEVTVEERGRTRIRSRYVISAPVAGQLARISLRAGDAVDVDQIVAQISPVAPQLLDERTRAQASARVDVAKANLARTGAAIRRAEAARQYARDQYDRTRKLQAQGGASEQTLEQSEYELRSAAQEYSAAELGAKVAANELEAARAALASMNGGAGSGAALAVKAPVQGQVLKVYQESEGVVQPGTPLLEVGDPAALEIIVDVLSTDAVRIPTGATARIERWGGEGALAARVRRKEPSAFTTRSALGVEEQRVPVILDLVEPIERWTSLGDGYRVEAQIVVQRVDNALVAPAAALFREGQGFVAFVVKEAAERSDVPGLGSTRAQKVSVKTGARTPDWVEVQGGLEAGAEVILYPSDRIADGVEIERVKEPRATK